MEGTNMNWRKSTFSENGGENCVETASSGGVVLVRDTIDRAGAVLNFQAGAWERFIGQLR